MKLHAQGRASGRQGQFAQALEHFKQAQQAAPGWPLPFYDEGYTYLLMGDEARALEAYTRVDALAPQGFSDSKMLLECLRRQKQGRLPAGTLQKYLEVQQLREPLEVKQRLEALTRTAPAFFPAWKELALSTEDLDEAQRLLEKALALEPDAATRGFLLVHRANLLRRRGQHEAARTQLQKIIDDPGSPQDVVTLARESLLIPGAP
jgi:tetratricopeptide (TPR) repeat protein